MPGTSDTNTKEHNLPEDWYKRPVENIANQLNTDLDIGLSLDRVRQLRKRYGKNELTDRGGSSVLDTFIKQFQNPLVLILLVSGIATLLLAYFVDPEVYLDAIVIFAALFINVIVGVIQEERASKAFEKLNKSQKRQATVLRDGKKRIIPAEEIVIGDVVILESGAYVAADMRIVEEKDLETNESALTGEWANVSKDPAVIHEDRPVAEQTNMAWMGTSVSSGEGKGVVTAVGDATQLGQIAQHLTGEDETQTPIQKNMSRLASFLAWITAALVAVITGIGLLQGQTLLQMVLVSIAIAVSVVPEGLPAAVTVVLAIGMERILDYGGLVRNLIAAETLGSTTVVLTDKTGTITQAKMNVKELIPAAEMSKSTAVKDAKLRDSQKTLLKYAILTTEAFLEDNESETPQVRGEPMERAMVRIGLDREIDKRDLHAQHRRMDYFPFSSENRFALSLNQHEDGPVLHFNSAPEFIIEQSRYVSTTRNRQELDKKTREELQQTLEDRSAKGLRIIGVAHKKYERKDIPREDENTPAQSIQKDLVFDGFVVFADPIREGVTDSIQTVRSSGAHLIMVTGDNPQTALTIAREAGVVHQDDAEALTGPEIEEMNDDELAESLKTHAVLARVLPSQKYRIANVLQERNEVVAMTGDGVNDAPALRIADIGVSVGSGTEVAKEASDLVLLNDSFSIIVAAIKEGRRIIDNLKKIVVQLIATNFGEVFLIAGGLMASLPLPILPAQILWMNIIEGGILTFAFAFEPAKDSVMQRDPSSAEAKNLLSGKVMKLLFISGIATGIFILGLFILLESAGVPLDELRTIMLAALTFDALFFAISLKDLNKPLWKINLFSNWVLVVSLVIAAVFLVAAITVPVLQELLKTTPITGLNNIILFGVALFDIIIIECTKYFLFERYTQG